MDSVAFRAIEYIFWMESAILSTFSQKSYDPRNVSTLYYIYIYAFSRRFYPKRLTVHSGYTFFVSVFPGNRTHNLCASNAML